MAALAMIDTPTIAVAQESEKTQLLAGARRCSCWGLSCFFVCLAMGENLIAKSAYYGVF